MPPTVTAHIAISFGEMAEWGCPHCGCYHLWFVSSAAGTTIYCCAECKQEFASLESGMTKSTIGFGKIYPSLIDHPHRGTRSHSHNDARPEGAGEFFHPINIFLDEDCVCVVCGSGRSATNWVLKGYVTTLKAGRRVVALCDGRANEGMSSFQRASFHVTIGSCNLHRLVLNRLFLATSISGIITPEIIAKAKEGIEV
jgi:hypothetical protein